VRAGIREEFHMTHDGTTTDPYRLPAGRVYLSGVQALVRLLLDQRRADTSAGWDTAAFVSGYQGSPLGTLDTELGRQRDVVAEHRIEFRPGVNEELAATSVYGTQLVPTLPGSTAEGVLGVWYGKSPGVDRATDALRHGNLMGTSPRGGVLVLAGDDPGAKSSTVPGASEATLAALSIPVFQPGSVQEVLDLGRHAVACSRESGLMAALKVVTRVADATATVEVGPGRVRPLLGDESPHRPHAVMIGPALLELERSLVETRLDRVREYARRNGLVRLTHAEPEARLGIVAAGTAYHDLLEALEQLGISGVRILQAGLIWPLDDRAVRGFAAGLDEVLVLEEKGPFLELLVKDALYGLASAPVVTGKKDPAGARLVSGAGALDAAALLRPVANRVLAHHDLPAVARRLADLTSLRGRSLPLITQRTPFFCPGCPHNTSTRAADDTLVGAGIGCHAMVLINPDHHGTITGVTQMGGEGAQWIGMAPFTDRPHFVQNLGDGTFAHSGSLAIRSAVAAGVNITYKLLYNDAVAMTGGQRAAGRLSVPDLTRLLAAEGVRRIVVTTEDTSRYRRVPLAGIASVRPREDLMAVQEELAAIPGTTVLIHDQQCAIEKRRARRRGTLAEPAERVLINERICEGCGDCGDKSGCLAVEPVDTEFGRKTRIHQSSCTKDFSCLAGDCPSFLTVVGTPRRPEPRGPGVPLPDIARPGPGTDVRIRMVGIGGTGVVTVAQLLGAAAMLDGLHTAGLDQTGLSQKGGPVVSDLRLAAHPLDGSATAAGSVDLLLGLDLLGAAAPANLAAASPDRTVAVLCDSVAPTGRMATDVTAPAPDLAAARAAVAAGTREAVGIDARNLASAVFGDHLPTNVIMLGAAWQRGVVPVSRASIEQAIRNAGVAVEQNLAAFAWGRAAVAAPEVVARALDPGTPVPGPEHDALVDRVTTAAGELRRLVALRIPDLVAYPGVAYAERYADAVAEAARRGGDRVAEAVARGLYKLMAYKDEYEVARLHLELVRDLPAGTNYRLKLHPPVLRALGRRRKIGFGRRTTPLFRLLYAGRRLRGTPLDPFGHTVVRRTERALVGEYLDHVGAALGALRPENEDAVVELCALPDVVRGYEHLKLAGVDRFRKRAAELRAELAAPQPGSAD
jgi:indolepyruvate ferredoxin oxidoreductase